MTSVLGKNHGSYSETTIDDEIVVMRMDNGEFYSLTGTARAIWLLLDGTRDRAELIAALGSEFRGGPAEIGPDVDAFLNELDVAGLLARV